jgi:predicted nucleic acid-binding protein
MNVVDSSAWLEYFANGPNASFIARSIEKTEDLVVPTISLYEVFKGILQQRDEESALQGIVVIQQGQIVDLDPSLALTAARLSLDLKVPMADSIMLATARASDAVLWTQDVGFKGLPRVRYRKATG